MAEFDPGWIGWDWEAPPDKLMDRMTAKEDTARTIGGVALVRIETDPRQLIADIQTAYGDRFDPTTNRYLLFTQNSAGKIVRNYKDELAKEFPDLEPRIAELNVALRQVMDPVRYEFGFEPDTQELMLVISKNRQQKPHSDHSVVTAWAGSSHPGFAVYKRNYEPVPVPALPPNYVLLFRGDQSPHHLGPVRHAANYQGDRASRFALQVKNASTKPRHDKP